MLLSPKRFGVEAPQPATFLYKGGSPYCSDPHCVYCNELRAVLYRCTREDPPETSVKKNVLAMATRSSAKVVLRGKEYEGEYEIDGALLRVFFEGKSKASHISGSDPELFARLLLIELLNRV